MITRPGRQNLAAPLSVVMEYWRSSSWRMTEVPGEELVVLFHLRQIRRGLAWDKFRALAMRIRGLTAWTMSRPICVMFLTRSVPTIKLRPWWMNEWVWSIGAVRWQDKRGLGESCPMFQCHLVYYIPCGLVWDRTRVSALRSRRLIAWTQL